MASLIVEVVKIDKITEHPNADRLELATIKGWQCVIQKDIYNKNDKVIYLPIDSILPPELESELFPIDSKIKLTKSRIRSIKIRKALSQGMIIPISFLPKQDEKYQVGDDVKELLNITKFEPPAKAQAVLRGNQRSKKQINSNFRKYTDIENFKNYPKIFDEGDLVIVSEKVHGTSFRCGHVKFDVNTWFRKILNFFKRTPKYEFVYGSRNVQLQNRFRVKIFYDKNVYAEAVAKYNLMNCLRYDEVVYGEIYGSNIQTNYTYGCVDGERKLVIYDVTVNGEWLNYDDMKHFCHDRGLTPVTILYDGEFDLDKIKLLATGSSVMAAKQKIIEGIVIRSLHEEKSYMGRKILKLLNDEYLLNKDNTDLH